MKIELTMPRLRPEMKSGILCAWTCAPGDKIKAGDVVFEVETDKVVSEIEAEHDMTIVALSADEGDEVKPDEVIALAEIAEDSGKTEEK